MIYCFYCSLHCFGKFRGRRMFKGGQKSFGNKPVTESQYISFLNLWQQFSCFFMTTSFSKLSAHNKAPNSRAISYYMVHFKSQMIRSFHQFYLQSIECLFVNDEHFKKVNKSGWLRIRSVSSLSLRNVGHGLL